MDWLLILVSDHGFPIVAFLLMFRLVEKYLKQMARVLDKVASIDAHLKEEIAIIRSNQEKLIKKLADV